MNNTWLLSFIFSLLSTIAIGQNKNKVNSRNAAKVNNIRLSSNNTFDTLKVVFDFITIQNFDTTRVISRLESVKLSMNNDSSIYLTKENVIGDYNKFLSGKDKQFYFPLPKREKYQLQGEINVEIKGYKDPSLTEQFAWAHDYKAYLAFIASGSGFILNGILKSIKIQKKYNLYKINTDSHEIDQDPFFYKKYSEYGINARKEYFKKEIQIPQRLVNVETIFGTVLILLLPTTHIVLKTIDRKNANSNKLTLNVTPDLNSKLYTSISAQYKF